MLHLVVVASINNSRITYPEFIAAIPQLDQAEDDGVSAASIMGRDLTEADMESDDVVSNEAHSHRTVRRNLTKYCRLHTLCLTYLMYALRLG